jgi:hypothetical protein
MEVVHKTEREKLALQQHSSTRAGSGAALHPRRGLTCLLSFCAKKTRLILDARPVDAVRGHPSLVELRLQHSRHKKINVIKN